MTKMTLSEMMAGLHDLTREELTLLNKQLIVIAKNKSQISRMDEAAKIVGTFQIGDVITFEKSGRGRLAGRHYFKYSNLNRNGDSMQGYACDSEGVVHPLASKWTVSLTQPTAKVHMRNGKHV